MTNSKSFLEWLKQQREREDAVGEFARSGVDWAERPNRQGEWDRNALFSVWVEWYEYTYLNFAKVIKSLIGWYKEDKDDEDRRRKEKLMDGFREAWNEWSLGHPLGRS